MLTRPFFCLALLLIVAPTPAQTLDPTFKPELVSVELTARDVRPGDPLGMTLKFRNAGATPGRSDYRLFVHLEEGRGCRNIAVHADHPPAEPTTAWQPGGITIDGPRIIHLPADLPEREYMVHVGVFDHDGTGRRLLDSYAGGSIRISRQAPAASQLGPKPLAAGEVTKRRTALAARIAPADRATLETAPWRFDVDRRSGAWALVDKATGVLWTSDPLRPRFGEILLRRGDRAVPWRIDRFDQIAAGPNKLRLVTHPLVDGKPTGLSVFFTAEPVTEPDGLRLAYREERAESPPLPPGEGRGEGESGQVGHSPATSNANRPHPLPLSQRERGDSEWHVAQVTLLDNALSVTDAEDGRLYIAHRLGIERAAARAFPGGEQWRTYDQLSMAMAGAVKQGSALLVNWDNVDTRLSVRGAWPDEPLVPGRRTYSLALEIASPQAACTLHPLGRGDYVEIARAYRSLARAKGWLRTWTEKRKEYPTVDRLFGASNFKPFVFSRVMPTSRWSRDGKEHTHVGFTFDEAAQCAEHWRNDLQIDRASVVLAGWVNGGYDVRHPDLLPAAPECGGNAGLAAAAARIKACGYLFGLHDNYQDMYEDAPSWGQAWLNKDARGASRRGGNWNGGQAWQVCAIKQVELAARPATNLPEIARLFSPTIYFIDTVFAWDLVTCEDPAHPMTRLDDLRWKSRLCLLAKRHFGLFGSEEGREWAVPCADYLEGIFGHQTDSPPGSVIPLFPLVYSDCVEIMTHQGNRIGPGDERKVADHVLFAEMPLPAFGNHLYWKDQRPGTPPAGAIWSRGDGGWGERLCQTDRVIKNTWEVLSPLNVLAAERPLDSHEFLTPDRLVQRTRFGDVTITVAYQRPARIGDDAVPAYGFIVESPGYVAFCATRYNGRDYASPALFTARSLDGRPIAESSRVRIYHGFGDPHLRLAGREFEVAREEVVRVKNP